MSSTRILLSNDDGVRAEGISVLRKVMAELGEVIIVAPDRDRSAVSHSLTLHRPLRVKCLENGVYAVDGTPADAVYLGVNEIMKDHRPTLVIAGINRGGNLGDDVNYSGTVAAAREAVMMGIPAFSVSNISREEHVYTGAALFALRLARYLLQNPMPKRTLLNVNVPNIGREEQAPYRLTRLGNRVYGDTVIKKIDPRGESYYWIGGEEAGYTSLSGSDLDAVADGMISVTPIRIDQTDHEQWDRMMAMEGIP